MKRRQSEDCLSDLQFDRWLSGELGERDQPSLEAHLARCSSCRQRRAELEGEQQRFAQTAPGLGALPRGGTSRPDPAQMPRQRAHQRSIWVTGAGALAAAAALALLVTRAESPLSSDAEGLSEGTRTKGGIASLGWIVRRGSRVFSGHPDQRLRPGDALRFTVRAREPVYVAVLGLDGAGHLSVYHPEGERLSKLEAAEEQTLPVAIELDATPGEEQLYGVFCKSEVPLAAVTAALERSSQAPALPNGCVHERWSLQKELP